MSGHQGWTVSGAVQASDPTPGVTGEPRALRHPRPPRGGETTFVVVAFVLFSGALLPLLRPEGALNQAAGDPLSQAIWLSIYAITAILLWRQRAAGWLLVRDPLLAGILLLVLASPLWSYAPEVSLRKAIGFLGSTLFAVYVAHRFSLPDLLRALSWFLGVSLVGSLVLVLAVPSLGIDHVTHAGAWKGWFEHKNEAGRLMVFGALVFGLQLWAGKRHPALIAGGLGCVAFLLLTTSKTALLVTLCLGALLLALPLLRGDAALLLGLGTGALVFGGVALAGLALQADQLATLLGRDLTLTGRTGIWEAVFAYLRDRLWLGYGYEAFWLGEAGDSAYVWWATNYHATFSHNGFLEVWLDVGLVGLAVLLLHMAEALRRALLHFRRSHALAEAWFPLFLAFALAYNATEAFLLKQNNFFWIAYCITTLKLFALRPEPVVFTVPTSFAPPRR